MTRRRSRSGTGTHVALLRAIKVGGRNRLPMARLVGMFDEVECQRVRTYIQSGNVVFDVGKSCVRFKQIDDLPLSLIGETVGSKGADQAGEDGGNETRRKKAPAILSPS